MRPLIAGIWILFLGGWSRADTYVRQPDVDVLHYDISVELTDSSDSIAATAKIRVRMRGQKVSGMTLDFAAMQIDGLRVGGVRRPYVYGGGLLAFGFGRTYRRNQVAVVEVRYHGKPGGGLRIGRNKYGRRVFFTESWPDRAHYWLPSIDHPSDKATVDVAVTAPAKYRVVSNGRLVYEKPLRGGRRLTRWAEGRAIPTYCIALAAAEFTVARRQAAGGVPLEWYAFAEDSEPAARKFRATAEAVDYFSSLIAPYPYEKLAQVQASVSLSGMENSSAIFYSESTIRDDADTEAPVPHEIAHQWFGDSVTQSDWDHLWLSEGFATYLEALFYENRYGAGALKQIMADCAGRLISDASARQTPIIDPAQTDLMKKLNPVNYDKGAWFLHMLRGLLGDARFFEGLRRYYRLHKNGNATSEDFRKALEPAGGVNLGAFFRQWLYQPGWPEYRISWHWDETARAAELSIRQDPSGGLFDMPLDIVFEEGDRRETAKVRISEARHSFRIPLKAKPSVIAVDPNGWVLKNLIIEQF